MIRIISLALILIFSSLVFGQATPLAQAEYAKLLYSLQKNPASKTDVIDSLRKRGINFVLTDGLRDLTRSKSGNDEDIRRALEEADRRRQNPESARVPNKIQASELLAKTRQKTLQALEAM